MAELGILKERLELLDGIIYHSGTDRSRKFTSEEFHRLTRTGFFKDGERVELIEGEVIELPPIGSEHGAAVERLSSIVRSIVEDRGLVQLHGSIRLFGGCEPQPDLALLKPRNDAYELALPVPPDILLLVEFADEPGDPNLRRKADLYSAAGITDYWIVNLPESAVDVLRNPSVSGFAEINRFTHGEKIAPLAFSQNPIAVSDVLG